MKQLAARVGLALVACAALSTVGPVSAQDEPIGQVKAELAQALKYALEAQARKAKAERQGDQEEIDAQWGIMDENFRKVVVGMNRLADEDDKKNWKLLCKIADKVPAEYGPEEAILKAATTMQSADVQKDIKKRALKFDNPKIRRALVLRLAQQKEWGVLLDALKDKDEGVASLAAWKLMDNKVESAIEPLLDRLEKLERDRAGIWDVLHHGMGRMLGKKCNSAVEYRSWWTIVQNQGGLESVHPEEEKAAAPGELSSGVRLFGREIDCTRIVFILDVSGSMQQKDPDQQLYDDDGGSRVRDAGKSGAGGAQDLLKTRLERAQRQLKNVLERLPANYKVNIVAYSGHVKIWRGSEGDKGPQLHELNAANRKAAQQFVDEFRADGVTATDTALLRAFDVQDARCFYLLSDGFATHDGRTQVPTPEILGVIDDFKDRHVIIHTLGFKGADVDMMQQVAEKTGGKYSDIK